MSQPLSEMARRLLAIISEHSYIPQWTLSKKLGDGVDIDAIHVKINPRNEYEQALHELVEQHMIEELPELHCRFRAVSEAERALKGEAIRLIDCFVSHRGHKLDWNLLHVRFLDGIDTEFGVTVWMVYYNELDKKHDVEQHGHWIMYQR